LVAATVVRESARPLASSAASRRLDRAPAPAPRHSLSQNLAMLPKARERARQAVRSRWTWRPSSDVHTPFNRPDHVEHKINVLIGLLRSLHHGLASQPGMLVVHEVNRCHEIAIEEPFGRLKRNLG